MTCKLTEKRNMTVMLIVGVLLAVLGAVTGFLLPDEAHAAMRCAGVATGAGASLALMGGGVLLWRRQVGEARARDSELGMCDERGQMIAYKAQNVLALSATGALVAIIIAATVRGDLFYMGFVGVLVILCTAAKVIALRAYEKRL